MHRLGHKRRGGGGLKPTWYVFRVVPRAPAGVSDASGLRRGSWGIDWVGGLLLKKLKSVSTKTFRVRKVAIKGVGAVQGLEQGN